MHKKLLRVDIPDDLRAKLARAKLEEATDVLSRHEYDLSKMLDAPEDVVRELVRKVSELAAPPCMTGWDLLLAKQRDIPALNTTLTALDAALQGGLAMGSITEVVGPPGVGKTQFCHLCSVVALTKAGVDGNPALNATGGVLYIDTESSFSAKRVLEIAAARFPGAYGAPDAQHELASRIHVFTIKSSAELAAKLETMDELVVEKNVRMIILDSIASVARVDFDSNATPQRQNLLARIASQLKQLAEASKIPVLVVNQITTATGKALASPQRLHHSAAENERSYTTPALGVLWSHSVNTRLVLDFTSEGSAVRRITVAKSPCAPVVSFSYCIRDAGPLLLVDAGASYNASNYWDESIGTRSAAAPGT